MCRIIWGALKEDSLCRDLSGTEMGSCKLQIRGMVPQILHGDHGVRTPILNFNAAFFLFSLHVSC